MSFFGLRKYIIPCEISIATISFFVIFLISVRIFSHLSQCLLHFRDSPAQIAQNPRNPIGKAVHIVSRLRNLFLSEVLVIEKSGHVDMIEQHVERIVKIGLGVAEIGAVSHALHFNKTK